MNGWALFIADVLVMASLAVIAAQYTFLLFGWHSAAHSTAGIVIGSVVWIALMTWICYRGIELSARVQFFLLAAEIAILGLFALVALAKVYGSTPPGSLHPSLDWLNPFAISCGALVDGVLLGIFIYWGWDTSLSVNEESEDSAEGPGSAAVLSTILLLLIYVVVSIAAQAYHGTAILENNSRRRSERPRHEGVRCPWDKLLILAVLTSASACTQTTILPTARTTFSMARWGALPAVFGRVHPRYLTPTVSTLGMGALSARLDGAPRRAQPRAEPARRLDHRDRVRDRLLLRLHRPRRRLVLPARAPPQPLDPAPSRDRCRCSAAC